MRVHVLVRGRVQGVGFRWWARELAEELEISGWVRNRPDGTVEVAADGSSAAIERLRAALRAGPPGAVVSSVEELEPLTDPFDGSFTIRR
jgi:acylphosphatase